MNLPHSLNPARILVVDDNEDDVHLLREAVLLAGLEAEWHHTSNGVECLRFLHKEEAYSLAPAPDLILLDLNMPVMDGREALEQIMEDESLRHLPVVVLTTSSSPHDIRNMYSLGARSYLVKPIDFGAFVVHLKVLFAYWFETVERPS